MTDPGAPPQAPVWFEALLREIGALRGDIADLREDVQLLARVSLAREDREKLSKVMPLISGLVGDRLWSSPSLYAAAVESAQAGALAAALAEMNTDSGGLRSFGKLLARGAGRVFNGFRLRALPEGGDREGALYQVVRVSRASKPAPPVAAGARGAHDGPQRSSP